MFRYLCFFVMCLGSVVQAQTQDEIAAARLRFIAGEYEDALKVLLPAAEAGDANAQNIVATAFEHGDGVAQDHLAALSWYEKSAAQGFDKAIYNLGLFYEQGINGAKPNLGKAVALYEQAVGLDYHWAMNNLALMYVNGRGVSQDYTRAIALYEQAIKLGNTHAMNNLARLYVQEDGVPDDHAKALGLFRQAADLGDVEGVSNLGAMYENGFGVEVDTIAALTAYRFAADRGHAQAALNLSYLLIEGPEGWRDPAEGYGWCLLAVNWAKPARAKVFEEDCAYQAEVIGDEAVAAGIAWAEGSK